MSKNNNIPEAHDEMPDWPLPLRRVGVKNVRTKIRICNHECRDYEVEIEAFINLPRNKRGAHISRFIKVINEAITRPYSSFFDLVRTVANKLFQEHEYSDYVEVYLKTNVYKGPYNPASVKLGLKAEENNVKEFIKIKIEGLTVCPCVQKVYSFFENTPLDKTPTHMQRTRLCVTLLSRSINIDLDEFIELCLSGFSSQLEGYLNRYKEYLLIKRSLNNPRFVEDVVRKVAFSIFNRYKNTMDPDTYIKVSALSYESIHPFNVYAEFKACLRDLENVLL
ncbi:MAG: hypothetical protein DRO40_02835 [Thermoprotei archaeon]|nr:MAG: hypothetical protein DRO40_02835 [Thermoprotei archaeon]